MNYIKKLKKEKKMESFIFFIGYVIEFQLKNQTHFKSTEVYKKKNYFLVKWRLKWILFIVEFEKNKYQTDWFNVK